jgi:hypothetical protein
MAAQPIECPQCQAPLNVSPGRKFCQCAYCGGKFAVELAADQSLHLARFESLLSATAGKTRLHEAEQRLADLELSVADAEDDVECKQADLSDKKSAYWLTQLNLQRLVSPVQNRTYLAGLFAALAAFLTLFVFKHPERLPGLAAATLLAVTGWAFHREWQDTEAEGQSDLEEDRAAIQEAEALLHDAQARLEDQALERELIQRQVLEVRSRQRARA